MKRSNNLVTVEVKALDVVFFQVFYRLLSETSLDEHYKFHSQLIVTLSVPVF
jgi:hypothetical protein